MPASKEASRRGLRVNVDRIAISIYSLSLKQITMRGNCSEIPIVMLRENNRVCAVITHAWCGEMK